MPTMPLDWDWEGEDVVWELEMFFYDSPPNIVSYRVTDGTKKGWAILNRELNVIDAGSAGFSDTIKRAIARTPTPVPLSVGQEAVAFARVVEIANKLSLDAAWNEAAELAGMYLDDAAHHCAEYIRLLSEADSLHTSANALRLNDVLKRLRLHTSARRHCYAALCCMYSAEEAAFFEVVERLGLPMELAEHLSALSFHKKWTLLAATAGKPEPEMKRREVSLVAAAFNERVNLVHVPPRLRRAMDGSEDLMKLLPDGETLGSWIVALEAVIEHLAETLGADIPLPDTDSLIA